MARAAQSLERGEIAHTRPSAGKENWCFQLLDQLQCGFVLTDREARICYANPAFCDMSGYSRSELVGHTPKLLQSGATSQETYHALRRSTAHGEPWSGELLNRHKTGSLYWESLSISPIRDAEGEVTHFVGLARDVDEERRTEAAREERALTREHERREELLHRIAGGLAHHLNNLLTSLVGNTTLALQAVPRFSPAYERLRRIDQVCDQATTLTSRFFLSAGIAYSSTGRVDLRELIVQSAAEFSARHGARVSFEFIAAEEPCVLIGDRQLLSQLLRELLENAAEACTAKDRGAVQLRLVPKSSSSYVTGDIRFNYTAESARGFTIELTDNGCGMSRAVQQRAFEPFYSTKFLGRGLGLAAVLSVVQQHHGALSLTSHEGNGTCVEVFLPAA